MSEPFDPSMDEESYAAALDRLLDGLDGDGPTDAQVRADTEAIARGLGLIGGALAAEGAHRGAAAPGATVVAMSSWRSKLNPRVLAAAASLVVVIGVGIPLAVSSTGGGSDDDAATALSAPEVAADRDGMVPQAESAAGEDALAQPGAAGATDTSGSAAGATGGVTDPAPGAPAPMAAQDSAPTSGNTLAQREAAAKTAASQAFADDVACARAIFVGTITALQPMPDGKHFQVSFLVEDWIVPDSGAVAVTYEVLGSSVNSPGVDENTVPGQRRLFVIPASSDERMYAYREKDWAETRKQIDAVRKDRAGEGC